MEKKRYPNLIGGRRMAHECKKRALAKEQSALKAKEKRDEAKRKRDYGDYEFWRIKAIVDHEVALEMYEFADEYIFY